ncbi:MAG: hypothetical protein VB144_07090 [Clostridia bacterium]|nr:hypothetical protein [Clostridia bacterium]
MIHSSENRNPVRAVRLCAGILLVALVIAVAPGLPAKGAQAPVALARGISVMLAPAVIEAELTRFLWHADTAAGAIAITNFASVSLSVNVKTYGVEHDANGHIDAMTVSTEESKALRVSPAAFVLKPGGSASVKLTVDPAYAADRAKNSLLAAVSFATRPAIQARAGSYIAAESVFVAPVMLRFSGKWVRKISVVGVQATGGGDGSSPTLMVTVRNDGNTYARASAVLSHRMPGMKTATELPVPSGVVFPGKVRVLEANLKDTRMPTGRWAAEVRLYADGVACAGVQCMMEVAASGEVRVSEVKLASLPQP